MTWHFSPPSSPICTIGLESIRGAVFMTGFSNGAAMTFRFAAERPDDVAAIAAVSGYCPHVGPMSRPVPTHFLIGSDDPLVPITGGEVVSPWDGRIEHGRRSARRSPAGPPRLA